MIQMHSWRNMPSCSQDKRLAVRKFAASTWPSVNVALAANGYTGKVFEEVCHIRRDAYGHCRK